MLAFETCISMHNWEHHWNNVVFAKCIWYFIETILPKKKPMSEVTKKLAWENGKKENGPSIGKRVPWKNWQNLY